MDEDVLVSIISTEIISVVINPTLLASAIMLIELTYDARLS